MMTVQIVPEWTGYSFDCGTPDCEWAIWATSKTDVETAVSNHINTHEEN